MDRNSQLKSDFPLEKKLTTCSSCESASTMFGVCVAELPDPAWFVTVSGTDEGLEERLMAPPAPAVELTPSSVVSLLVVTEVVVVSS